MQSITCYNPDAVESAAIIGRIEKKQLWLTAGGHCDACDCVLPSNSFPIRGFASGQELGLCTKCTEFVNSKEEYNTATYLQARGKYK